MTEKSSPTRIVSIRSELTVFRVSFQTKITLQFDESQNHFEKVNESQNHYEKVSAGRSKLVTNYETGNDRKFQRAMREELMQ